MLILSLLPLCFATTETRYFRSDTAAVNGLTTEILGTTNSATFGNRTQQFADPEVEYTRYYWGHQTYKRTSGGSETELTSGVSNLFYRSGNGQGWQNVNWTCPQTSLTSTDSIVVRIYATMYAGYYEAWTLLDTWQTGQLGTTILNNNPWNFTIYTYLSVTSGPPKRWTGAMYFGNKKNNSRILGFMYGVAASNVNYTFNLMDTAKAWDSLYMSKDLGYVGTDLLQTTDSLAFASARGFDASDFAANHDSLENAREFGASFDESIFNPENMDYARGLGVDFLESVFAWDSLEFGLAVPFEFADVILPLGFLGFTFSLAGFALHGIRKRKLGPFHMFALAFGIVCFCVSVAFADVGGLAFAVLGFVLGVASLAFPSSDD